MPAWDCQDCWRDYNVDEATARRRFERTTVYTPDRVTDAFVCAACGGLLTPFVDDVDAQ